MACRAPSIPASPTGVTQSNAPFHGDHNNFGPRIGLAWDMFGNGKTILRTGGGILYEQISLDVFNGIGNSFGLRVPPTGATFVSCSVPVPAGGTCPAANSVIRPGSGTINVVNVAFQGTPIINNNTPGTIPFQWANNGSNTPIYSLFNSPACGDGNTVFGTTGFKPTPCNAMFVDSNFRTPYVANWTLDLQRQLTSNMSIEVGYVGNHGTKLIGALDVNQPSCSTPGIIACAPGAAGPGWTTAASGAGSLSTCLTTFTCTVNTANEQLGRPYNSRFPFFKFIDEYGNIDRSNYHALQAIFTARNYHGFTLNTGYTYSHALGESADQGTSGGLLVPINSYRSNRTQLYSSTTFDMRHRLTITGTYNIPGKKSPGQMLEGWSINGIGLISTGTPWGVNDTNTDFAGTGEQTGNSQANQGSQWTFIGNTADFTPDHNYADVTSGPTGAPGVPFFPGSKTAVSATANAACNSAAAAQGPLAVASLRNLGCYALGGSVLIPGPYGGYGFGTRNLFRDHGYRNMDFSVSKNWKFTERFTAQFRAEFFNILNHVNFTNPSGGPGGNGANTNAARAGSSGNGLADAVNTPDQAGSNPVLGSGGARHIQLGLKLLF